MSKWFSRPLLPRTLKTQAMLVLCLIFLVSHAVSLLIYEIHRNRTVLLTEVSDLAARITGIVDLSRAFPAGERQQILAAAETQFLAMFPEQVPLQEVACQENDFASHMRDDLQAAFADLPGLDAEVCVRDLSPAPGQPLQGFDVLVSVNFPDGDQTIFHALLPPGEPLWRDPVLIYLLVVALVALLLAIYLIRRVVAPLERLARAADQFGVNIDSPPLDEKGSEEVSLAARAFNRMQTRLGRLVHGQTEMIAAISHDLRSAVTRLQLRAEMLSDGHEREGLLRVVEDMRLMIQSMLDFVRGNDPNEKPRRTNVTALVESLCDDLREEGYPVTFQSDDQAHVLVCRPTALRRSFQNVIDNAIKYGRVARVEVTSETGEVVIRVRDEGPGIPEDQFENVLRPFYRLEKSRSQDTGGVGLGLAIAQNIVQGHGGVFTLRNRKEGGLEVEIRLIDLENGT